MSSEAETRPSVVARAPLLRVRELRPGVVRIRAVALGHRIGKHHLAGLQLSDLGIDRGEGLG